MNPNKDTILDFYRKAFQRCLDGFSRLDEKEWNKKASDHWTAKEHLAHLVSTHECESMVVAERTLAGKPLSFPGFEKREDCAPYRKKNTEALADVPVSELLTRFKDGIEAYLRILDGLSEADLDRPSPSPGWDHPGAWRDHFFANYLFLPNQYQQIRKVNKKKLRHWIEDSSPEEVNFYMGRTYHYMPLIFWSGRAPDLKATYLFNMEGPGGGQWTVRIANGVAETADGPTEGADLEFKTKPEVWVDLAQGDMNPVFAITMRKVHLSGNVPLAMKLSELFSVE